MPRLTLLLLLAITAARCCIAQEPIGVTQKVLSAIGPFPPVPIEQALREAATPRQMSASDIDNMAPASEIICRLTRLVTVDHYQCEDKDLPVWKAHLLDPKEDIDVRLCAACFLLSKGDQDARKFILAQAGSKDDTRRYYAVDVVGFSIGLAPVKSPAGAWGITCITGLMESGSLDPTESNHFGSLVGDLCQGFGFMKAKEAVPAIISVLKRNYESGYAANNNEIVNKAAGALGDIGDKRAIPALIWALKREKRYSEVLISSLGELKATEAVPLILSHLGHCTKWEPDINAQSLTILEALQTIGDKRAIPPIEEFLKGDFPGESKAAARRVLAQMNAPDPVAALIELLDAKPGGDESYRLMYALSKHDDPRVIPKLLSIANTSDSQTDIDNAVQVLGWIGNRQAYLALASLLDVKNPTDAQRNIRIEVVSDLEHNLKQDFGTDRTQWEQWLTANYKDPAVTPAQNHP